MPRNYKGITKRAAELLANGENADVDYKLNAKFSAEDLVAFANSDRGGALLLGVEEHHHDKGGPMIGKPAGLPLTDQLALAILAKANSCHPPVAVSIFGENLSKIPFVRIEIPASSTKPHCTSSGVYKIRLDGANSGIKPTELLEIFVHREAEVFVERFKKSTEALETTLEELEGAIEERFEAIGDKFEEQITELKDQTEGAVSEMSREIQEDLFNLDSEMSVKVGEIQTDLDSRILDVQTELEYSAEEQARSQSAELAAYLSRQFEWIHERMSGLEQSVEPVTELVNRIRHF